MRVISGTARGLRLTAPSGLAVRPTADRLREALFSSLSPQLAGATWWDACSGTGAVGIEALSRGARWCVFSDNAKDAIRATRDNVTRARVGDRAEILELSWEKAAQRLRRSTGRVAVEGFDFIYFDPPYDGAPIERFVATALDLLGPDGTLLYEHRSRPRPVFGDGVSVLRTLACGSSSVTYLRLAAVSVPPEEKSG